MSVSDFWSMPFFAMVEMAKSITPNDKSDISRKDILDSMRYNKTHRGWI